MSYENDNKYIMSMSNTLKIATGLLLSSIATIFINGPMVFLFFKINDLLLFGSLVIFIVAILRRKIFSQQEKKLCVFFIIWLAVNVLGTLINFAIFKHLTWTPLMKEYGRMVACFLIFIEIATVSRYSNKFLKLVLYCLTLPSIILPIIYLIPQNTMHYLEYINGTKIRFEGLFENPNAYAQFMIIPIILLLFFILRSIIDNKKNLIVKLISFFLLCLSVGTILWSGSRSGIIGLVSSFIIFIFFLTRSNGIKMGFISLMIILFSFPIGYIILPNPTVAHEQVISRVTEIKTVGGDGITKETRLFTGAQNRSSIWRESLFYIIRNPLGYGPESYTNINIVDNKSTHQGSHNIIFQLILDGGIFLLLYASIAIFKILYPNIINKEKTFKEKHILIAILLGIIVSSLFSDYLFVRWLWVILALIYSYTYVTQPYQLSKDQHP